MKFDHRNINVNNICQIIDIQLKNTMFLLMILQSLWYYYRI